MLSGARGGSAWSRRGRRTGRAARSPTPWPSPARRRRAAAARSSSPSAAAGDRRRAAARGSRCAGGALQRTCSAPPRAADLALRRGLRRRAAGRVRAARPGRALPPRLGGRADGLRRGRSALRGARAARRAPARRRGARRALGRAPAGGARPELSRARSRRARADPLVAAGPASGRSPVTDTLAVSSGPRAGRRNEVPHRQQQPAPAVELGPHAVVTRVGGALPAQPERAARRPARDVAPALRAAAAAPGAVSVGDDPGRRAASRPGRPPRRSTAGAAEPSARREALAAARLARVTIASALARQRPAPRRTVWPGDRRRRLTCSARRVRHGRSRAR